MLIDHHITPLAVPREGYAWIGFEEDAQYFAKVRSIGIEILNDRRVYTVECYNPEAEGWTIETTGEILSTASAIKIIKIAGEQDNVDPALRAIGDEIGDFLTYDILEALGDWDYAPSTIREWIAAGKVTPSDRAKAA